MALALNLLALIIVLGLCWGAMMWLSGRFHGQGHGRGQGLSSRDPYFERHEYLQGDISPDGVYRGPEPKQSEAPAGTSPCIMCEGVGAHTNQGKLAPCPECYGTGVLG